MNKKLLKQISCAMLLGPPISALASNIDATNKYAWSENGGWSNFNDTNGGVTVYNDHLEGYAWAENIGWIRLGTHTSGGTHTYAKDSQTNYGVNNSAGTLSGYAWSENAGWIKFDPAHGGGVSINATTGDFDGYAWGENVGWIHFQKTGTPAYKVSYEVPTISIAAGTTPTEAGTVGTYTVTLSQALPNGQSVTINYNTTGSTATNSDDYSLGSADTGVTVNASTIEINNTTGSDITSITLNASVVDDSIDDDAETVKVTLTSANNGYIIASASDNATLTITDNDTAGFTVTEIGGTSVNESGTTDTFTVVLDTKPTSDVVISVTSGDTGEATVDKASLTFTTSDWNTTQIVTVTGVDDAGSDGDQTTTVTISVVDASSDDQYDPLANKTVSVTTVDNDTPGFTVNPTTLTVSEPSGTATFTITLNTQPSASNDVSIASISASNGECSVSPTSTIIANANWNTGTTFTVAAQNDNIVDGNQTCTIQIGASASSDADYNNVDPTDVTVTVQDDDTAGIDGTDIGGSISITEGGATGSYDFKLGSQPTGDVEITVTADTQTTVSKDGGTSFNNSVVLTFTNGDWNTAKTITVQAIDDAAVEGSHTSTISHAITGTPVDANYPTSLA
ncbi:hypothetical protein QUF54_06435, partial [Candidatus Marithioploca araucensis]|nr:hypothetical protein [Candidatus Marithioploca araucensis]